MEVSAGEALAAARVARQAGHLRVALRALEVAFRGARGGEPAPRELAAEAGALGERLEQQGAPLAALGCYLRARLLGHPAVEGALARLIARYAEWRPAPGSLGVPRDGLKAGASGAFWVGPAAQGRILTLDGQITTQGTGAFRDALSRSLEGVAWLFVDMSKLSYVGSTGLAEVVKVAEHLREAGGGLSLFGLSSTLRILVEMLGVEDTLNPVDTLQEALERL